METRDIKLKNFNGRQYMIHTYELSEIKDLQTPQRPLAIVIPGGSFNHLSQREGEPVALAFAARGFQVAVMEYNLVQDPGDIYPDAALDVLTTVKYFKNHAAQYRINPEKIVTVGFSAGGHVASVANNFATDAKIAAKYGFVSQEVRPSKTILGYPLINIDKLGMSIPQDQAQFIPQEQQLRDSALMVNPDTPATFIFHAWDDPLVLIENSLEYVKALRKAEVVCELHIFARGGHGFSLARPEMTVKNREWQNNPHASHWFNLALEWLQEEWQ